MKKSFSFLLLALALLAAGCAQGTAEIKPPEIRYGEDVCAECKMIISDPRFAAAYAYEIASGRYETVAFDDAGDMLAHAGKHPEHQVAAWYVHDYETKEWINATTASYLVSSQVETPMASGIASFANRDRAEVMAGSLGVPVLDWSALLETFKTGEMGAGMSDMVMPTASHD